MSSSNTWKNGTIGACLLIATFGCSGGASLGGNGDAGVGGFIQTSAGGASSMGGKHSTGGSCALQECFRAYECVEQCGGPVVNSGCCQCTDGTIDRVTACVGAGGSTSTGGSIATGGATGAGYSPCGNKKCGDVCTICPPDSTTCVETNMLKECDSYGSCVATAMVQCGASGGAPGTGGASSTSTYQPCGGKQCGDNCTICPPNSADCTETAIMKSCNEAGQCLQGPQRCTATTGGNTGAGGNTGVGGKTSLGGVTTTGGTTGGTKCGAALCGAGEECCNASCSQCVPKGYSCITVACTTGGSTSLGGATSTSTGTSIPGLHQTCTDRSCPSGLTPVEYYGIAGTSGPLFCSCEIPCSDSSTTQACPSGLSCSYVADGPGRVCY